MSDADVKVVKERLRAVVREMFPDARVAVSASEVSVMDESFYVIHVTIRDDKRADGDNR